MMHIPKLNSTIAVEMELSKKKGESGWGAMPSSTSNTYISVHVDRQHFEEVFRMSAKPKRRSAPSSSHEVEEVNDGEEGTSAEGSPLAPKRRRARNQRIGLPGGK